MRIVPGSVLVWLMMVAPASAMMDDDPWLTKVMSEFELLEEDGETALEWDVDVWMGRDLQKFWIKSTGEYVDSDVEQGNVELVYSRAVSAYWDQQFGIRHDFDSVDGSDPRNWISAGYIGTAPYFVDVDARIFVGEESSTQLLIELERELMLTQRWVLTPELDIIANGSSNPLYREGSGLAEVEFSLRLGYERSRKFQPFVGVAIKQLFGGSKRFAKADGGDSGAVKALVGIHSWF